MEKSLRDISDIIEYLKDMISFDIGDKKVKDEDVAKELEMTPGNLAVHKSRGKVPYDSIVHAAVKKGWEIDKILLKNT